MLERYINWCIAVVTLQFSYFLFLISLIQLVILFQGRQAIEWVIGKLQTEMKEITSNAIHNTDDLINFTKKSLYQVTHSVDDISLVTKKSIEDLQQLTTTTQKSPQNVPST